MSQFSIKAVAIAAVLGGAIAGAVSASAALNLPTQSCSYMFNTNMRLGSRGVDVMNLQKVLNAYAQTRVAVSGAGSPGMETMYFGMATRAAVNKFHTLHLAELGISAPTGNVFALTRALLNQVCSNNPNPNPNNPGPINSGPVSAMLAANQPSGMIVAGQSGARLADITFTGSGTVTNMELQRTGVSADTALTNVYLYDGNVRITDAASVVTGGLIRFNAGSGLFTVNGSRTLSVRADIAAGTGGQSVGVKLNSLTAMGSGASTFTNVMGPQLQISSATTAAVNLAALVTTALTVDAGTVNYNVWKGNATVSTRDVWLRAATFKFVGSAPVDAIQNLSLYVDGVKIAGPSSINASNNNKLTFDLGSMPYLLKTGTRSIDVRGDVVKGSFRTVTFSIENVADLMLEDSQLMGVNVSATVANAAMTQGNTTFGTITINKGSVTVNTDPAFTSNKVTGGATNVPVGQFTLKAYGEDVKVNTLKVTFSTTTISTLNNVSLYANGAQVGTSANYTVAAAAAGGITFSLGSSLIIPAGQTVTLTVRADIVDTNNAAYTSGSIAAVVGGVANNAQGQNSNELVTVASSAVTGNSLTISSASGTFARTSGFTAASVAPNTANVKIGSFTLQAGSAESLKVNSAGVNPAVATYAITNLSNLTLKSNGAVLGTPVGNPTTGTTTFSFNEVVIPANGTQTFEVYADIGGASTGSVTAAMEVTYRGSVSNQSVTSAAAGVAITSAVSTLAAPTLSSTALPAQFVVGGSTFTIASYKLATAVAGTVATVKELRFTTTGTDAIESITVNGITSPVIGSGGAATTTISGLSIPIDFNGPVGGDIPVTVKFSDFQGSGGSLTASVSTVNITLGYTEATSGSGTATTSVVGVASNNMRLVGSKPTVSIASGVGSSQITLGAENKIGEFTVTADANGQIGVASTSITVSTQGITGPEITAARVADGNTTITGSIVTGSSTLVINFDTPTSPSSYVIPAGTSKTFSIFATVSGTQTSTTVIPYVSTKFTSAATFLWLDVLGGNTEQTGALIYNFPTGSYTTTR